MTKNQLDDANALVMRINRLKEVLEKFKIVASNMDESLIRMTGFNIESHSLDFRTNINQGELLFLIEAFEKEINRLEMEFGKI